MLNSLEVDESVADVASILEIDGKIEEVEQSPVSFFNRVLELQLCVLIGDVLDHERGSSILQD